MKTLLELNENIEITIEKEHALGGRGEIYWLIVKQGDSVIGLGFHFDTKFMQDLTEVITKLQKAINYIAINYEIWGKGGKL